MGTTTGSITCKAEFSFLDMYMWQPT